MAIRAILFEGPAALDGSDAGKPCAQHYPRSVELNPATITTIRDTPPASNGSVVAKSDANHLPTERVRPFRPDGRYPKRSGPKPAR